MTALLIIATVATLAIAGMRSLVCACAAVLITAAALVVFAASTATTLVCGLLAAAYLLVIHLGPTTSALRRVREHATRAALFGGFAAVICAGTTSLPWLPVFVPLAVLALVLVPRRPLRA